MIAKSRSLSGFEFQNQLFPLRLDRIGIDRFDIVVVDDGGFVVGVNRRNHMFDL